MTEDDEILNINNSNNKPAGVAVASIVAKSTTTTTNNLNNSSNHHRFKKFFSFNYKHSNNNDKNKSNTNKTMKMSTKTTKSIEDERLMRTTAADDDQHASVSLTNERNSSRRHQHIVNSTPSKSAAATATAAAQCDNNNNNPVDPNNANNNNNKFTIEDPDLFEIGDGELDDSKETKISANRSTSFSTSNHINIDYAHLLKESLLLDSSRNDQSEVDLQRLESCTILGGGRNLSQSSEQFSAIIKPTINANNNNNNNNNSSSLSSKQLADQIYRRHNHYGVGGSGPYDGGVGRSSGKSRSKLSRCHKSMETFLLSPRFNLLVVILVIVDCIFVSLELIIDITITMQNTYILQNFHQQFKNLTEFIFSNESRLFLHMTGIMLDNSLNVNATNSYSNLAVAASSSTTNNNASSSSSSVFLKAAAAAAASTTPNPFLVYYNETNNLYHTEYRNKLAKLPMTRGHTLISKIEAMQSNLNNSLLFVIFYWVEEVLRYMSVFILAFFVIEISLKVVFAPQVFKRSKWEIFDAFIVFTSFALDLLFLNNRQLIHTVTGWITLFRLWRITRIINGIIVAVERKSNKKIKKLDKMIAHLRRENDDLRCRLASCMLQEPNSDEHEQEHEPINAANLSDIKSVSVSASVAAVAQPLALPPPSTPAAATQTTTATAMQEDKQSVKTNSNKLFF